MTALFTRAKRARPSKNLRKCDCIFLLLLVFFFELRNCHVLLDKPTAEEKGAAEMKK